MTPLRPPSTFIRKMFHNLALDEISEDIENEMLKNVTRADFRLEALVRTDTTMYMEEHVREKALAAQVLEQERELERKTER